MGKLVRDRIPEIIEADGRQPVRRTLDDSAFEAALLDKLLEEAAELHQAPAAARLEEAADVYEVLSAWLAHTGHSWADVRRAADDKRRERGGFEGRVWLDSW